MARRATVCRENSLSTVDVLRSDIRDKFKYLHIALDERESELMYRLDEVTGIIANALKQWNSSINDVEHTISHANSDIRDNKWGFKLLKEAREELDILEKSKPSFEVDFKMNDGIKEVIANLGEVNIKQTNKQTDLRNELGPYSSGDDFQFECPILRDQFEEKFEFNHQPMRTNIKRKRIVKIGTNFPEVPFKQTAQPNMNVTKLKLVRSISCVQLSEVQTEQGLKLEPRYRARAFDDSCISNKVTVQPNFRKTDFVKSKEISIVARKISKTKRDALENSFHNKKLGFFPRRFLKKKTKAVHSATYKLSELKIHTFLTHRVTLTSRWNKKKEVHGTLRCVVSRDTKVPIVGIQLDTNDGTSNGYFGGIQYFKTENHRAYFLPADEVLITI